MSSKTLTEWLSYLETLHPKAIDLGLSRIQTVAERLHLQKPAPCVITVAGTNGKGTCVTSLAAIYREQAYRVGAYTSPHLWNFRERIQINGEQISETALCEIFEQIEQARQEISLTYFEFTTLAAFCFFQTQHLDVAILEVGMGGRLDAVNMMDPDLAIITTVDLDHEQWLGNTREKIGKEKAGIIRPGIPVVLGRDVVSVVEEEAQRQACPIYRLGKAFEVTQTESGIFSWKNQENFFDNLAQNHLRTDNLALSLMTIVLLESRLPVSIESIRQALRNCRLPGRQQVLTEPVWQMFDVAHNPEGMMALAETLEKERHSHPGIRIVAIFSMLRDKNIETCVRIIAPHIDVWHVAGLEVERGMTSVEMGERISSVTPSPVYVHSNLAEAFHVALAGAEQQKETRLLVFGSFHTVASLLAS